MKAEYDLFPSKFLLAKIELVDKKIKQADKAIGKYNTPNGNYTRAVENA